MEIFFKALFYKTKKMEKIIFSELFIFRIKMKDKN
jgi:hypothetical protein